MTKAETEQSSQLQEVKITELYQDTLETGEENPRIQITENVNNEPAPARGRKRLEF